MLFLKRQTCVDSFKAPTLASKSKIELSSFRWSGPKGFFRILPGFGPPLPTYKNCTPKFALVAPKHAPENLLISQPLETETCTWVLAVCLCTRGLTQSWCKVCMPVLLPRLSSNTSNGLPLCPSTASTSLEAVCKGPPHQDTDTDTSRWAEVITPVCQLLGRKWYALFQMWSFRAHV